MTVVSAPTALNSPSILKRGVGGNNLSIEQAVDAANGNKIPNFTKDSVAAFRTTAVGGVAVTVYADVNGQECPIDVVNVPGNAANGGVQLYRPPLDVDWSQHNTSVATATGSLVFKSASANLSVSSFIPA